MFENMCCRYYYADKLTKTALREAGLEKTYLLGLEFPSRPVTPGMESPILLSLGVDLCMRPATWGFPAKDGSLVINARAESVLQKPMFSSSMEKRRCIIPATHFYEWDAAKNRVEFNVADRPILYLAGFWQLYEDLIRYVILTTAANGSMAPVHDRMPLMLEDADLRPWLYDLKAATALLHKPQPQLVLKRENEQLSFFTGEF